MNHAKKPAIPKLGRLKGALIECIVCKECTKDNSSFLKHLTSEVHKKAVQNIRQKADEKKKQLENLMLTESDAVADDAKDQKSLKRKAFIDGEELEKEFQSENAPQSAQSPGNKEQDQNSKQANLQLELQQLQEEVEKELLEAKRLLEEERQAAQQLNVKREYVDEKQLEDYMQQRAEDEQEEDVAEARSLVQSLREKLKQKKQQKQQQL